MRLFYCTADDNVPDGKPVRAEIRMRTLSTGEENVLVAYADAKRAMERDTYRVVQENFCIVREFTERRCSG